MNEQQIETLNQMLIEHENVVGESNEGDKTTLEVISSRDKILQYVKKLIEDKTIDNADKTNQ